MCIVTAWFLKRESWQHDFKKKSCFINPHVLTSGQITSDIWTLCHNEISSGSSESCGCGPRFMRSSWIYPFLCYIKHFNALKTSLFHEQKIPFKFNRTFFGTGNNDSMMILLCTRCYFLKVAEVKHITKIFYWLK